DRTAKYNQLLRIEEELEADAVYPGWSAFPRACAASAGRWRRMTQPLLWRRAADDAAPDEDRRHARACDAGTGPGRGAGARRHGRGAAQLLPPHARGAPRRGPRGARRAA